MQQLLRGWYKCWRIAHITWVITALNVCTLRIKTNRGNCWVTCKLSKILLVIRHLDCPDSININAIVLILFKIQFFKCFLKPSLLKLVKVLLLLQENYDLLKVVPAILLRLQSRTLLKFEAQDIGRRACPSSKDKVFFKRQWWNDCKFT